MSKKSTCPPRAGGAFRIYAYAAQLDIVAIYAPPSPFVAGTTR
jgi:hypothetical protein